MTSSKEVGRTTEYDGRSLGGSEREERYGIEEGSRGNKTREEVGIQERMVDENRGSEDMGMLRGGGGS